MPLGASSSPLSHPNAAFLSGRRVFVVGRLRGMSNRDFLKLLKKSGAAQSDVFDSRVDMVFVGEDVPTIDMADPSAPWNAASERSDEVEVLREAELWQRLGLIEAERHIHRLYTPAMLAELSHVPVAIIRRWHRRGLIVPAREIRRLPYFDFNEVATARRLAEWMASGMSPRAIEKKLVSLSRWLRGTDRPLAQLSILVEGRQLLLRQGDGLLEPGGQLRFNFDDAPSHEREATLPFAPSENSSASAEGPRTHDELVELAAELEDQGRLDQAVESYRAALAAGGPRPETCFRLAELLYRLGDAAAARERYFMAIELDENYVEARANLGCVLAESSQLELAVAAFEGALRSHDDYADARYHLARTLDELGRTKEAEEHWRRFLEAAAESPWAAEARSRLSLPELD